MARSLLPVLLCISIQQAVGVVEASGLAGTADGSRKLLQFVAGGSAGGGIGVNGTGGVGTQTKNFPTFIYWGQNPKGTEPSLLEVCNTQVDTVIVGFVTSYGASRPINISLVGHDGAQTSKDIVACKAAGVKVLLSFGGVVPFGQGQACPYGFSSDKPSDYKDGRNASAAQATQTKDVTQVANTIYDCFFTRAGNCSLPASANPFSFNTTFTGYDLSPYCAGNSGDPSAYSLFAQVLARRAGDAESAGQRYTSTLRSSATVGAAFPDPILGPLPASEGQSLLGTTASAQFVSRVGIKLFGTETCDYASGNTLKCYTPWANWSQTPLPSDDSADAAASASTASFTKPTISIVIPASTTAPDASDDDFIPPSQLGNIITPISNLISSTFAGTTLWNAASDSANGAYASAVRNASQPTVGSATGISTSTAGQVANTPALAG